MGLADVSAAVCAVLNTDGASPATLMSSTNFLNPVRSDATAVATPLQVGRSIVVVGVDITDDSGRLGVRVTQTISVRSSS